ncbi:uroporphyrinogen decarboxylase family protein [Fontivita pretiosa]|uniref:uroporphyrinogen decarboxylase family protein n=1 Tax=Fontivita pretiosa TaxID=2989684 RepID=UPI003D17D5D9
MAAHRSGVKVRLSTVMTGRQRVVNLLRGQQFDRQPLFDAIRNDRILEYFAAEPLTYENAERVCCIAHARAVDSTRMIPKRPVPPMTDVLPDGRQAKYERWTRWVEHRSYESLEQYIRVKEKLLEGPIFSEEELQEARAVIAEYVRIERQYLRDIAFFWGFGVHDKHQFGVGCRSLQGYFLTDLYEEVGLDRFFLFQYDAPELISALLERQFARSVEMIKLLPDGQDRPLGLFIADDLAYKQGPFASPKFFEKEYWPGLKRVCDAAHERGLYVMFHTDGDLTLLIDGLVGAGIDILNPLEKVPFHIKQIHQRHPRLVLSGGIDVSHLLPYGKPAEIIDAVHKAIDDAEGRILIGSSSIVTNNIPLENFLAMRRAVGAG